MKWRDVLGLTFLIFGVAGCMTGIRGFTGDAWWGGPAIGAGVVVNALAYRTMRSTTRATPKTKKEEDLVTNPAEAQEAAAAKISSDPDPHARPASSSDDRMDRRS